MDNNQMRAEVRALYDGPSWKKKVDHMPDNQIFAIWKKEQDKPVKEKEAKKPPVDDIPF